MPKRNIKEAIEHKKYLLKQLYLCFDHKQPGAANELMNDIRMINSYINKADKSLAGYSKGAAIGFFSNALINNLNELPVEISSEIGELLTYDSGLNLSLTCKDSYQGAIREERSILNSSH